jgi:hypothetical protein
MNKTRLIIKLILTTISFKLVYEFNILSKLHAGLT